jgi:hypothetical protein
MNYFDGFPSIVKNGGGRQIPRNVQQYFCSFWVRHDAAQKTMCREAYEGNIT